MADLDPVALGAVLAHLVGPDGRTVKGGTRRGQLYVSSAGLTLVATAPRQRLLDGVALGCLFGSVGLLLLNLLALKEMAVLWVVVAMQGVYMVTLPVRRRLLAARPLSAAGLAEQVAAGRVALHVPAGDVRGLTEPTPGTAGRRTPARVTVVGGALDLWLDAAAFAEVRRALGRD